MNAGSDGKETLRLPHRLCCTCAARRLRQDALGRSTAGLSPSCHKEKGPTRILRVGPFEEMPDNDLLSHGETPHYHRRRAVFTTEFGMGSGGTDSL